MDGAHPIMYDAIYCFVFSQMFIFIFFNRLVSKMDEWMKISQFIWIHYYSH